MDDGDCNHYNKAGRTYGNESKEKGFFGKRSASSGLKPGTTNTLVPSKSMQLLKPIQNQLKLKIPKQSIETVGSSQIENNQWQKSVGNQLQRFRQSQNALLNPKPAEQSTIELLKKTSSMKSFSNLHPQFRPLNCEPYTRERHSQFGFLEGKDSVDRLTKKPISKIAVSLTGERVMQGFGPSSHLHKMKVLTPSQTGAIVGSGSNPYTQSELVLQARKQTKKLRLKLLDQDEIGASESVSQQPKEDRGKFAQKLRASAKESRNSNMRGSAVQSGAGNYFKEQPMLKTITSGEVPITEEILRKHYLIAKVSGKTTFESLKKEISPQKHIIRHQREYDDENERNQIFFTKRDIQNEEFAIANERVQQMEKLQQQAASYMRLNAVWGLEPNDISVNIQLAQVDPELAVEGGVIYNCINNDRQLKTVETEDSDLDRMIFLFQSQPDDNYYFIYCKPCNEKDPYDLVPLINYTTQKKGFKDPFIKFGNNNQQEKPENNDRFYTLSKKGFTLYEKDTPTEHTPLEEWLLERKYFRQIRSKDFFKNFRTWSIIRMWRRNILQKHREQIKAILQNKLFSIDDVFGPILSRHRKSCKEMEQNRIIDVKSNGLEVNNYEEFETKQKERRFIVTQIIKEKSRLCRVDFQDGINKILDQLRALINEQTEEDDKKNEYMKASTDEMHQPKQIVNTNPTLDALGFNHSLKYGNRSKLRNACSRFLRFSYLLDFIATEALTNIYLFSIQDTITKLQKLATIPVRYEFSERRTEYLPPTGLGGGSKISIPKKQTYEIKSSVLDLPFFKVNAAINQSFLKPINDISFVAGVRGKNDTTKTRIKIPKQFLQKISIYEYYPKPAGNSQITDFNPSAHMTLEPELQKTEESDDGFIFNNDSEDGVTKIEITIVKEIEKLLLMIEPSGEKFSSLINDSILEGMECLTVYERWSRHPDLNKYERVLESWDNRVCSEWEQPDKLFLDCDEWLVENDLHQKHGRIINDFVRSAFDKVTIFFETYRTYLHAYWENEQIDFRLLENDRLRNPVESIHALIDRFQRQKAEFEEVLPDSKDIGMIRIDCSAVKKLLVPSPKDNLKELKDLLPKVIKERIEDQKKWLRRQINEIKTQPTGVEQYVKQIQQLDFIESNYQTVKDYIELNSQIYNTLIEFDIVDTRDKAKRFMDEAYGLIRQLDTTIAQARESADKRKNDIKEKIMAKIPKVNEQTQAFSDELDNLKYLDIESEIKTMIAIVDANDIQMNRLINKKDQIQNYQKTLDMGDINKFENVDNARDKHKARKQLWHALYEWTNQVRKWQDENFDDINVEEISKEADKYTKIVMQYDNNKTLDGSSAFNSLKQLVLEFRETMPIVQALGNRNLTEEHWTEIKALLNMQEFPLEERNFTLGELMGFKVASKQEEVENISVTATQEFKLAKQIMEINETWLKTEFEIEKYKDKDFILSGIDKVVIIIDESLSEISDIQGSRYVKRLHSKVQKLQEDLILVSDTIEQWRECQRNWLYLENIFSSKDIRQQRPKDYGEFEGVNRAWSKLMKKVSGKRNVIKNCTYKQYQEFVKYNEQMDKIQKNLEVYLEEKRTEFPRFFFISNDELLQLLAEQKIVASVEKHLNKCFDNINSLFISGDEKTSRDDDDVHGMVSAEGEIVPFIKQVKKHNMGVELWLGNLRKEMKLTVNRLIKEASKELNREQINKLEWVLKHCGQSINVVSKIKWTEMVEEAMAETEEDSVAVGNLAKVLNDNLTKLVDLIRTPSITNVKRKILVSLITQEVHGLSIVEQLADQQVESSNDFQWQQCLRYYENDTQKSSVVVRQVNSSIKYGCEYMGATSRLVITPLTDRCWLTITGALHIKLGASPQGPAGTGKTESTKDLAKGLGIYCVVFNCSEQVEYKIMGRLFSGLVQSGAWSCLDEFNRIDVEVLSVIAQQLLDIRQAKLANTELFVFNEKEMPLKPNCGVFITMNPGYAGRAELPDNLKVLFRPVAMMIPSYGLVAQVMLFAEGYNDAQKLSTKMVQLYKLSDEQLSQQDHYDFGMRAVKSVLVIAGNLKRSNPNLPEDVLLIRAMRDANVPKFLADDLPLFNAIVQDLFPNVQIPEEDQNELGQQIVNSCEMLNLMMVPTFKLKCLQLFDTFNVRFGVMLVGPTGGGKSTCFSVLQHAMTQLKRQNVPNFDEVKIKILNPKSISMGELYGEENKDTKEWTDGLASKIMRKFVEDKKKRKSWTVFDGPVDALWIENMNTVLDDNMTLCLANGERIKLQQSMRILFEVQDLKVASPATVSRCGMVYMTPSDLGWKPYVHQWMNYFIMKKDPKDPKPAIPQIELLNQEARNDLLALFQQYVDEAFLKMKPYADQQQLKSEPIQIVKNICNFLEYFLSKPGAMPLREKREIWIKYLNAYFGFSFIWAFGGNYRAQAIRFIDNMMRDFFSKLLIPLNDTVFDYRLDEKSASFLHWKDIVPKFVYPETPTPFFQLVVSTIDTMRTSDILRKLTAVSKPVFITGNTGSGKSLIVQQFINQNKENMELTPIVLNFSAQTTSHSTQINIESKLIKKRQKVFGAKGNSKTLIFIDDVNMPGVEQYGAQPPIELMRQLIDHGGIYDRPSFFWKKIEKFSVVCAAAPPSGGRSELTPRFMRHFMILNVPDAQEETLKSIFESILGGFMAQEHFGETIRKTCTGVAVFATIDLYTQITKNLLPIPAKFHYTFNLRDIAKVFQGILLTKPISIQDNDSFARLWLHEATRVFADRLCTTEDINFFQELAIEILNQKFKVKWANKDKLFKQAADGLFSVILRVDSDSRLYEMVEKKAKLLSVLQDKLVDYNFSSSNKMDLVFFDDAIRHIIGILRILMQPRGNSMLIGVSGSGKQSLTRLAASILEHVCFQVKLSKNYKPSDFRDSLRDKMLPSGNQAVDTTFILNDTQIMHESFLEDVNNILNTGEITNLYTKEDIDHMDEHLSKVLTRKKIPATKDNVYNEYIEQLRDHFHIILCMSPVGDLLRNRCRKFPSLVNCCTLDWFFSWPEEALLGVAEQYLKNIDNEQVSVKQKKAISELFPKIHKSVEEAADRFSIELRRKTYVTPKSYLDGIQLYIKYMEKVKTQHNMIKSRYEGGVTKLNKTNAQIEELKIKLTNLIPKLEVQNNAANIQAAEIKKNKEVAQVKEMEAESDAAVVRMDAQQIEQLKREAENELRNAAPALEAANKAVDSLDKNDVADLKQTKNPTPQTEIALKCILTYLGYAKPDWPTAQKAMADIGFLGKIRGYDKEHIDPKIMEKVKKIVTDKINFNIDRITQANRAAGGLAKWCIALYRYVETLKIVQPIEANVKRMTEKYQATMREVEKKQKEVQIIKEKLQAMEDQLNETMTYIDNLVNEKEKCEQRLVNAGKLIDLLGSEGKRWEEKTKELQAVEVYFNGNVFLAAATLSYLGPFNGIFRENLLSVWKKFTKDGEVNYSEDYSFRETLGDPVQIRNWNLAGLPSDNVSIDNAILAAKSQRWPLMIDPEQQANKWIRKMFKSSENQLSAQDFALSNFGGVEFIIISNEADVESTLGKKQQSSQKQLETAIIRGQTVLFEDVGADLDPGLDSILSKAIFKEDGIYKINFGDKSIVYDENFRFMMTTKLSNPHFLPETCIKTTVINFSVTFQGLEDQLLVDVINNLQPDLEKKRDKLIVEIATKKNDLYKLQSLILKELAESNSETILDNEFLIETLEIAKHKSVNTQSDLIDAELVEKQIDHTRDMHREVAERGSILYFVIVDISMINEMYQNSLQYVKKLFNEAIEKMPIYGDTQTINDLLKESITKQLYQKISIGLFEEHKIVFAFLICTGIKRKEGCILDQYWNLLIRGPGLINKLKQPPKPENVANFISDAQWDFIYALQKISTENVIKGNIQDAVPLKVKIVSQMNLVDATDIKERTSQMSQHLKLINDGSTSSRASRKNDVKMDFSQSGKIERNYLSMGKKSQPDSIEEASQLNQSKVSATKSQQSNSFIQKKSSQPKSFHKKYYGPFHIFCQEIEENAEEWERYIYGFEPYEQYFYFMPVSFGERLTNFEKLLLIKIFKPEKIAESLTMYLEQEIGPEFAISPVSSIENLFLASDSTTPIIFVLSQGVDPTWQIIQFAEKKEGMKDKFKTMSLGQGQDKHAARLLDEGMKHGHWVMLQNCHLFRSWMPQLALKVSQLLEMKDSQDENNQLHPDFRLILTSMPVDYFPTSVLQSGLKMTTEPPRGIKNNLQRSYMNIVTQEVYDEIHNFFVKEQFMSNQDTEIQSRKNPDNRSVYGELSHKSSNRDAQTLMMSIPDTETLKIKSNEFRNLLFGLTFFHAVIQERRKFGPLGWNITYEFSDADLSTSITMIKNFLIENEDIPWDAMKFMTGQINYGGRVTDDFDRLLLMNILQIFQNDDIVTQENYKFSKGDAYYCPQHEDVNELKNYINELPNTDEPEIFGMHQNAHIVYLKNESLKILNHVLNIQPRVNQNKEGVISDTQVLELCKTIVGQIPELIDTEAFHKDILKTNPQGLLHCFSTVLMQELYRYNLLLSQISQTLEELQHAVKGIVLMNNALDSMYSALLKNQVPKLWQQVSYPSLKPLGSWMQDLKQRVQFMKQWAKNGHPKAFWLSGFFFPHGFITGILQTYARKHHKPIDLLQFSFNVLDEYNPDAIQKPPVEGVYVYGLFIENARWSTVKKSLVEAELGEMNCKMPIIHFLPKFSLLEEKVKKGSNLEEDEIEVYKCPVYKTNQRAGILSTTGKSTNFILTIDLACLPEEGGNGGQLNKTDRINLDAEFTDRGTTQELFQTQLIQVDTPEFWILRGVAIISMLNE